MSSAVAACELPPTTSISQGRGVRSDIPPILPRPARGEARLSSADVPLGRVEIMTRAHRPWYRRPSRLIPTALLASGMVVAIVAVISPWPAALLIRAVFQDDAKKTVTEMEAYAPTGGLTEQLDVSYGDAGSDTTFDVFTPDTGDEALTTVVWIHGGAWISGTKENVRPYVRMIAAEGYTTVSL